MAAFAAAGGAMNLFMGRCRGGRILRVITLAIYDSKNHKSTNPNHPQSLPPLRSRLLQIPVNLVVPSQPLKELIGDSLRPLSFRFTRLSLRRNQGD